ncbi:MAG: hypothetical protein M3Q57_03855 [Pseudomonadota bacterium]|nr:hypothetical protein [Pseudomonadota bacterium]
MKQDFARTVAAWMTRYLVERANLFVIEFYEPAETGCESIGAVVGAINGRRSETHTRAKAQHLQQLPLFAGQGRYAPRLISGDGGPFAALINH